MAKAIGKSRFIRSAPALATMLLAALALGGCQSPMYSGTPDDMSAVPPSYQERSYVGRNEQAGSGRANTQM